MRRANRKDTASKAIVEGLRLRGFTVYDMPQPGDILVYGYDSRASISGYAWLPLEIKTPKADRQGVKAPLTASQKKRNLSAAPIPIVETLEQALALYGRTL